jgi:hypothetical protein
MKPDTGHLLTPKCVDSYMRARMHLRARTHEANQIRCPSGVRCPASRFQESSTVKKNRT